MSFNIHMTDPNVGKLTSMHFHGWKKGLKTGMYYLRTKAAVDAIKFTVDQAGLDKDAEAKKIQAQKEASIKSMKSAMDNAPDDCVMCGA